MVVSCLRERGNARPESAFTDAIYNSIGIPDVWQMARPPLPSEPIALNYQHLRYFWTVAHEGSIAAAVPVLGVSQPTITEQLQALDASMGAPLFVRRGRNRALTEHGHLVLRYADEIFALGRELLTASRSGGDGRPLRITIGIADSLPKLTAWRLIEPAFALGPLWRVTIRSDKTDRLIHDLAGDALDLVITDTPMPTGTRVRAYSHLLGESGITVFAESSLAKRLSAGFPASLRGAPMLMPGEGSALRRHVTQWCHDTSVEPDVVAEVDDMAMLQLLGHDGVGVFCAPSIVEDEVRRTFNVQVVGRLRGVRERFYALSAERRLRHPAVMAIADAARRRLAAGRRRVREPLPRAQRSGTSVNSSL
jgi:LysR family transcriptional regulator, transcriptional activator of nhaA